MGYLEDLIKRKPGLNDGANTKESRKNVINPTGVKYKGVYEKLENSLLNEYNKPQNQAFSNPADFYKDLENKLGGGLQPPPIPKFADASNRNYVAPTTPYKPLREDKSMKQYWDSYDDKGNLFLKAWKPFATGMHGISNLLDNPLARNFQLSAGEVMGGKGPNPFVGVDETKSRATGLKSLDWATEQAGRLGGAVMMGHVGGLGGNNTLTAADDMAADIARKTMDKTGVQGTAGRLGTNVLTGALEGSMGNVLEGVLAQRSGKEIANEALQGALFGGVLRGGIGEGAELLQKAKQLKNNLPGANSFDFKAETASKMDNMPKPRTQSTYNIKNVPLEKVYDEYDDAVREIQNYWGHWKLDEAEIKLGAEELGIDLDGILNRMKKAETEGIGLKNLGERARMAQVAGVGNTPRNLQKPTPEYAPILERYSNPTKTLKNTPPIPDIPSGTSFEAAMQRSILPERFRKPDSPFDYSIPPVKDNLNIPKKPVLNTVQGDLTPPDVPVSKGVKLAEGTDLEGLNLKQLRAERNKLYREYVDYMDMEKMDMAEQTYKKIRAISDVLDEEPVIDSVLSWKDKPALALERETLDRNAEAVMGDYAPTFIRDYSEPIRKSEAERVRHLNDLREQVKAFDIKAGSRESELVQKFGEGEISLPQLQGQTKDWKKVVEASNFFRSQYDELLSKTNEVLERNGYKPIAKRENYFPHMGELQDFMEKIGIKTDELPTQISGITENFSPGKNFFANALQRKGDKTIYDAVRGFDNYIEGASKLIHHTDNIQRLRSLEAELRNIAKDSQHLSRFVSYLHEYTNLFAGKKGVIDRVAEQKVGRNVYRVFDTIRKQVGSNMVGANISSALTNFIPLTQNIATTSKPAALKGLLETLGSLLSKSDDFVNKSDFLTRRFGSDKLALSKWEGINKALSKPFEIVDGFTSQFVVRSKYNELITKGLDPKQAMKQADTYAARLMTDKSLGQLPNLFGSKTAGMLTQFQSEVNNQVSFILKDLPNLYKGEKAGKLKLGSAVAQMAMYSWIANNIYEQIAGRRPAIDIIDFAYKTAEDSKNEELTAYDVLKNASSKIIDQVPFVSTFTGGRIPIQEPFKGIGKTVEGIGKTVANDPKGKGVLVEGLSKTLPYLLPSGGNQLTKTLKGTKTLKDQGVYSGPFNMDKTALKYPVTPNRGNVLKGTLFGNSAFPETQEYYNKNRKPLGEKQTEEYHKGIAKGLTPQQAYDVIIKAREERTAKRKK